MLSNPLTPPERRKVVSLVADRDQALADKVDAVLAGDADPFVEALREALKATTDSTAKRMDDIVETFRSTAVDMRKDAREHREAMGNELRVMRLQVVGIVALALVLMAALVGVGVVYRGVGVSFSTTAMAAEPTTVDVVEDLEAAAGPVPQPVDPQL